MISETYNEDCNLGMKHYPDKWFDLAVIDVNYGIDIMKSGRLVGEKDLAYKEWDKESPPKEYFVELFRISKNQIIWGANHFISKIPFDSSCWIVWDKKQPEGISFASAELARTSFDSVTKTFYKHPQNDNQNRIHPTQKPVALYSWLYANYLPQGGKVIDTHLGSGSNRIAADKAGNIDFYGWELDKDYFEAQDKRFKQYKSQLVMAF